MDWNKTNTILIIAFLVVNIFLLSFIYLGEHKNNKFENYDYSILLNRVEDILSSKNISIKCDVPSKYSIEPFLQVDYKLIYPDKKIVEYFLGEYNDKVSSDIDTYIKNGEMLQIVGGKKIIYSKEQPYKTQINNAENVDNIIKEFCDKKNISLTQYVKSFAFVENNNIIIKYVQQYKGYYIENSYLKFYISGDEVYRFELQAVDSISERAKVEVIPADEALLRLMVYDDIRDCEITDLKLCYYTIENAEFESINSINVDLVWRAVIDGNKVVYLNSLDY